MYFDKFASNTLAGSSNQHFFISDGKTKKGRIFYKITEKGEYDYSFLFTNIIDSTYGDGSVSHKNIVCKDWVIEQLQVACCDSIDNNIPKGIFKTVTFNGETSKNVVGAEVFSTDPVNLSPNNYICVEITFKGEMIPYHEELIISAFVNENNGWVYDRRVPLPSMIGCNRNVKKKIAFLGDSITQGCGTPNDSYAQWNGVLAQKLGSEYAYWNLGIGYGRASDAASCGIWLNKATHNDIVFVCFGVNDILFGAEEAQIRSDIKTIVCALKEAGVTVALQTVPPFDYKDGDIAKWQRINAYIKTELAEIVDMVFDNVPVLSKSAEESHMALYGGHPNTEGCRIWAEAFYEKLKEQNFEVLK